MPRRKLSSNASRVSNERRRFRRPSWLWRWHHLISGFVVFFGVGMVVASLHVSTATHNVAHASVGDNLMGWIWADPVGWTSVNSENPGACGTPPCGSYGLNVDINPLSPTYRQINGFAWNDFAGWICFGSSCAAVPASCGSVPPTGLPGDMKAWIDPGIGTVQVHGWANVCNLGSNGWISLNCQESPGSGGAGCPLLPYAYRVVFVADASSPFQGYFGNPSPPPGLDSYGWNGNSDGTGYGYFDFRNVRLNSPENTAPLCSDGKDNNLNGKIDCADPSCSGLGSCVEAGRCADGIDNDANGLIDCADVAACAADPICIPASPESQCLAPVPTPAQIHTCCSNGIDDTLPVNGLIDCADPDCGAKDPTCTPAWIQAKFGNVYAQQGITAPTSSAATYCLTSSGVITGFDSAGCKEATASSQTLPKTGTGYQGSLGSLDINGILAGRYGTVVPITVSGDIPAVLGGKVYYRSGDLTLSAKTFQNGSGTTRGNGLLIVEGNLTMGGNVGYAAESLPSAIRNLASFGVIVKKNALGIGGNVTINPGVTQVSGAFFAESSISTGTNDPAADVQLRIFGLMAAHQFNLQRLYRSATEPAEVFTFDGRAVANPPPGMQDVGKTLPSSKDAF